MLNDLASNLWINCVNILPYCFDVNFNDELLKSINDGNTSKLTNNLGFKELLIAPSLHRPLRLVGMMNKNDFVKEKDLKLQSFSAEQNEGYTKAVKATKA